ncbi:MAG TPA: DUF4956 domain-containing protein [Gemmatimonadales bacterium]|nr:DUF4956 domain-containing protein [Gemmatimonadales bacterium]
MTDHDTSLAGRPLLRVVGYYLFLTTLILVLSRFAPAFMSRLSSGEITVPRDLGQMPGGEEAVGQITAAEPGSLAIGAMAAAVLLMLPVVWVYILTRQKKGYQQSLVQTLIILPIVVAGVAILVKSSVALAFSLGGIVGAVAFRNRLEDTKDAVYVFVSIAVGLASGVQAFHIAVALSLFFNLIILILWYTDFGRVPGDLSAPVAAKRIEAARGMVGEERKKSGEFVAVLDEQILQSMTPDQLQALTERAMSRRRKIESELYGTDVRFDGVLTVKMTEGGTEEVLRTAISTVLDRDAKEWQFEKGETVDGRRVLRYSVRTRKSVPAPLLVEAVRRIAVQHADEVTFR